MQHCQPDRFKIIRNQSWSIGIAPAALVETLQVYSVSL